MSYQIITKMVYNASTRHIETWQHSNNVWPRTDHFYAMDVGTDEKMFQFIKFIANVHGRGANGEDSLRYCSKNIRNCAGNRMKMN